MTEVRGVPRHFRHDAARLILEFLRFRCHCLDVDLLTVDERESEFVLIVVRLSHPHGGDRLIAVVGPAAVVKCALGEIKFGVELAHSVRGEEEEEQRVSLVAPRAVADTCAPAGEPRVSINAWAIRPLIVNR